MYKHSRPSVPYHGIRMQDFYLEPVGLIYGSVAVDAINSGGALLLAGGPIAFGAVRIWERQQGRMTQTVARVSTLQAIDDASLTLLMDKLTGTRASIAGVPMDRPRIMGIVNVTPDSFSDGGDLITPDGAIAYGRSLAAEGADFLDIGGESTRPGADAVPEDEELRRVLPVIAGLSETVPISIDTRKPRVMQEAVAKGAAIVNDVSGLTLSPDSAATCAKLGVPVVIMHAKGEPKTMQTNPNYDDVVTEVYDFLNARISAAVEAGIHRDRIMVDPGIGFGKTPEHNLSLLRSLSIFHGLGVPLVIGASRKGIIRHLTGEQTPKSRVHGSVAAALSAISKGAQIVRVHDVKATRQAFLVWNALQHGQSSPATHVHANVARHEIPPQQS